MRIPQSPISRRQYLMATTLAAAAAAAPSSLSAARLPMKKGILLGMLPKEMTMVEKFKLAKAAGFDGIEMPTMEDAKQVDEGKRASQEAGLPIHGVMNMRHWQFPLSSPNPADVEKSMEGMRMSLQQAKDWGASTVLLVPGVVNATTAYADVYSRSQKQVRLLLPMAEKLGVKICIENVWNKFLLSPLEFAQYVDSFKSNYVAAYYDVGNILLYGFPQDWIRTLGKRIAKVHFKDFTNRRDPNIKKNVLDWVNLRDGDLDWKAVHAALGEIGYSSYATLELSGGDAAYIQDLSRRTDLILNGE